MTPKEIRAGQARWKVLHRTLRDTRSEISRLRAMVDGEPLLSMYRKQEAELEAELKDLARRLEEAHRDD